MSRLRLARGPEWEPADLYPEYQAARDEAEMALAGWLAAPVERKRDGYAAYRAAADREDAAALAWMQACESYDAAHAHAEAA